MWYAVNIKRLYLTKKVVSGLADMEETNLLCVLFQLEIGAVGSGTLGNVTEP